MTRIRHVDGRGHGVERNRINEQEDRIRHLELRLCKADRLNGLQMETIKHLSRTIKDLEVELDHRLHLDICLQDWCSIGADKFYKTQYQGGQVNCEELGHRFGIDHELSLSSKSLGICRL